jgi:DNA-binding MarR family transcriptional regulator
VKLPTNTDLRLGPASLRVLARVLSGQRLVRGLARDLDVNPHAVQGCLARLQAAGLVAWEFNRTGTLVPTCRFVPVSELETLP